MRTGSRVLTLLIPLSLTACARGGEPDPAAHLTPCRIDGVAEEIRCTAISVPEDRSAPGGRGIALQVAVVPAPARVAEPDPLVLLAGGPGQAATSYGPWIESVFKSIRRHRDIVLIDQRGTGASHALACESDRQESAS